MSGRDQLREEEAKHRAAALGEARQNGDPGGVQSASSLKGVRTCTPRFGVREVDLAKVRPVEFVWAPWLVRGAINLEVGEEKVGKSTFSSYIVAGITNGTLPGIYLGHPKDVLMVSADEDDFNKIVVPRLIAAGADLSRVGEFYATDEESIFTTNDGPELSRVLQAGEFGLVVFEHLMDLIPTMKNYNDPIAMRAALRPLGRVLAVRDVGGLGALHVNKGQATSMRQKQQGTVQFGARSRSSFLIDRHPSDRGRKVAILGMANYVRDDQPTSLSFVIVSNIFELNGHTFDVGRVGDVRPETISMDDVLTLDPGQGRRHKRAQVADALKAYLCEVQGAEPSDCTLHPGYTLADLARAIGRDPKDGTVRNALDDLAKEGIVQHGDDKRWRPTPTLFPSETTQERSAGGDES